MILKNYRHLPEKLCYEILTQLEHARPAPYMRIQWTGWSAYQYDTIKFCAQSTFTWSFTSKRKYKCARRQLGGYVDACSVCKKRIRISASRPTTGARAWKTYGRYKQDYDRLVIEKHVFISNDYLFVHYTCCVQPLTLLLKQRRGSRTANVLVTAANS